MIDCITRAERRDQIARLSAEPARHQVLVTIEARHNWFTRHTIETLAQEMHDTVLRCLNEPEKVTVKALVLN